MTKPETEKLPIFAVGEFVGYGRVTGDPHVRMSKGIEPGTRLFAEKDVRELIAVLRAQGGGATPDAAPDAVRKDAERYAWLRGQSSPRYLEFCSGSTHVSLRHHGDFDAAIDAAIAHARSAGGEGRE